MVMPQVIALALLLGGGVYTGCRWFRRPTRKGEAELRADDELRQSPTGRIERDLGALEYDPASGVYKPVRRSNITADTKWNSCDDHCGTLGQP
jgi:hypothetical protein